MGSQYQHLMMARIIDQQVIMQHPCSFLFRLTMTKLDCLNILCYFYSIIMSLSICQGFWSLGKYLRYFRSQLTLVHHLQQQLTIDEYLFNFQAKFFYEFHPPFDWFESYLQLFDCFQVNLLRLIYYSLRKDQDLYLTSISYLGIKIKPQILTLSLITLLYFLQLL